MSEEWSWLRQNLTENLNAVASNISRGGGTDYDRGMRRAYRDVLWKMDNFQSEWLAHQREEERS